MNISQFSETMVSQWKARHLQLKLNFTMLLFIKKFTKYSQMESMIFYS